MRKYLLAATGLFAACAAHAQTCSAPAPAAAAGFTTQTFGGPIVPGQNWTGSAGDGVTQNSDGSVTIANPSNNHYNAQLSSAISVGGGAYIQGTLQALAPPNTNGGWPSFWLYDHEARPTDRAEVDMEVYGEKLGTALHDWHGPPGMSMSAASNTNLPQVNIDLTQPATLGILLKTGFAQFYLNGRPAGPPTTWSPGGPFSITDQSHLTLALGTGQTPVKFSNVQVWQASSANDIGVSPSALAGSGCAPVSANLFGGAAPAVPTDPTPTQAAAPTAAEIVPGQGSIADSSGNTWTVSRTGCIQKDGQDVPGGCQSAAVEVVSGIVWGKDNGHGPVCPGCWFQLSGANGWTPEPGQSPPASNTAATASPAATAIPMLQDAKYTCSAQVPNSSPTHGGFWTVNGQILQPDGTPFIAKGVNLADWNMAAAQGTLPSQFPGINFVRLNIYSYADPSIYQSFINWATVNGIVVEVDDHTNFPSNAFSGSQLAAETQFFSTMASAYKTNPYVWFETQNEPQGGNITAEETAVYNAVRSAGNNNPVGMQLYGGGNPGFLGTMDLSAYTTMENVFIAPHFYDWLAGYSPSSGDISAALQSEVSQAQQIRTVDGMPPVIIDEYGNSTNGTSIDSGGSAVVSAVNTSGYGSAAWSWQNPGGGPADQLTNGGTSLTSYGSQVAGYMTGGNQGCAQSPIPTITAPQLQASTDQTAPALAPAATTPTAPTLQPNTLTVDQVAAMAAAGG